MSILFISYNGLTEPLGRSQVLRYAEGLAQDGHKLEILSFEKRSAARRDSEEVARRLAHRAIPWHRLAYHQHPKVCSTLFDVARGVRLALARLRQGVTLIHARSHVPALIADLTSSISGVKYLFDHRGLLADEYADGGVWPRGGVLYRSAQRLEQRFVARAAGIVVLTERFRKELALGDRCVAIPCAVDLDEYCTQQPVTPHYDIVYAGSWSGLYLSCEMLRFFKAFRRLRPRARFLLLVPRSQALPPPEPGIDVRHADPNEVAQNLVLARAGLSFRRPGLAQRAASPVKVSEYLACGLPVVSSAGVGDLDKLLPATATGIVVSDFTDQALHEAASKLLALQGEGIGVRRRCRRLAEDRFALASAVARYSGFYHRLSEPRETVS